MIIAEEYSSKMQSKNKAQKALFMFTPRHPARSPSILPDDSCSFCFCLY